MSFWSDPTIEPKRKHTFLVSIGNVGTQAGINEWLCKSVDKPNFEMSTTEHKFLNHTFKFPGSLTWNDVNLKVVDVVNVNLDNSQKLYQILELSGYVKPGDIIPNNNTAGGAGIYSTLSKRRATAVAVGNVKIRQINDLGQVIEEWVLKNSWIKSVNFGSLEYGNDEMLDLDIVISYDWAEFRRVP
jgi:hypothetical protein